MKTTSFRHPRRRLRTPALGGAALAGVLISTHLALAATVTTLTQIPYFSYPNYYGYVDGATEQAQFHTPLGLAVDPTGNFLFVADRDNNAVRELKLQLGQTLTFVPNQFVSTNLVDHPVGVAVDSSNNVFVLNRGNGANGTVLEFNQYGDFMRTNATGLTNAAALALDSVDDIYVTVRTNTLLKITPGGARTTVATVTNAGAWLQGITLVENGLIAACDSGRDGILLIDPSTGSNTPLTGFNGQGDWSGLNNQGATTNTAQFFQPSGIAKAGGDIFVVTDYGNHRVKVIYPDGTGAIIVTNLY
ncbi:MAG: hypothetical protein KGJ60_14780, partial [Verrucomicrobiota bacterium]|nr:hypothetical protein [Verrucomicrobiota bacterium]